MSKVECLKKIIAKISGDEINDVELTTVCECLDKLAEVISVGDEAVQGPAGKDGTKWFVKNEVLSAEGDAPEGAVVGDLVLDSQGAVWQVGEDSKLSDTGVNLKS